VSKNAYFFEKKDVKSPKRRGLCPQIPFSLRRLGAPSCCSSRLLI